MEIENVTKELSAYQTERNTESLTILQRITEANRTAAQDCIETYGDLVWALARKYTDSSEEAETAAEEIFLDVWRYAARFDTTKFDEPVFVFLLARRRLIKRLL